MPSGESVLEGTVLFRNPVIGWNDSGGIYQL